MQKLKKYYQNQRIWIIGATDGIGKALTLKLDQLGAKLILSSRSKDKLDALAKSLNTQAETVAFDVSTYDEFIKAANEALGKSVDRIIYLPAYYEPATIENISLENFQNTMNTNLNAVFYLIDAVLPYLKSNTNCQLAITASVAGYIGLPKSQPYAASKAAVINLVESFKAENQNLNIKLINPSFVKTRLTDKNDFKMPALMTPEFAADKILNGLVSSNFEIHFTKKFTLVLKLIKILPYKIYFRLVKNIK
ncbi:SDR family NAD(P)-dependent oxidoreductase [Francisella frigiditurris]|uniref:Short chain dehydrogenase family protein n=1 Tax=Francisella frigiditurris TaxID=1542390 RepID=A0A1J0KS80_9GAMM|nr:SDR family NAD(P)-dependent oxidoreductase [Francisella frigiditurris]APC96559.1 short chain dehydrogenase family protein [Francisella frigiditurris]